MEVLTWTQMAAGEALEAVASYPIGQVILKQVDNFLWLLEKSSQWALPPPCADDGEKTMVVAELIRPLPWIFFLPILVFLRLARETVSFGALMMGKEPIRASSIVRFIQNSRRSLRAIKYEGIRYMRSKNQSSSDKHHFYISSFLAWFIEKLQNLTCYRIVKYSNGEKPSMIGRKNSGEKIVVKKSDRNTSRSPSSEIEDDNDLDDSAALLRNLLSNLEQFVETDSDDSDYSVKNEGIQISGSSSSDDSEDEHSNKEVEEYYQPEDEQNTSTQKKTKSNGLKGVKKSTPQPQCDENKDDALKNGAIQKKISDRESLKKFIESEQQLSGRQSELKAKLKRRSTSKSPKRTPKTSPQQVKQSTYYWKNKSIQRLIPTAKSKADQKQCAGGNPLPVVMVTPAAESPNRSPNKSPTVGHSPKSPQKKQQSPHHDRH